MAGQVGGIWFHNLLVPQLVSLNLLILLVQGELRPPARGEEEDCRVQVSPLHAGQAVLRHVCI